MAVKNTPKRGGPVVNNGLYRKLSKQVDRRGNAMRRATQEGYGAVDTAVKDIYKNLLTTQTGMRKNLDRANSRTLGKILDATAAQRAASRRITHATEKRLDQFGDGQGMLAGRTASINKRLASEAKSAREAGRAGANAATIIKQSINDSMDTRIQGTKEAAANAELLAAEAFSARTSDDLALISQQKHDIAMSKLQHQQELATMRKQFQLQERMAEETIEKSGMNLGLAKQQIGVATSVAQRLLEGLAAGQTGPEVLQELVAEGIIDQADMDSGVVKYLARAMAANNGPGADRNHMGREIWAALEMMPEFAALKKKDKERIKEYVFSNVNLTLSEAEAATEEASGGGGGFFDWLPNWYGSQDEAMREKDRS